MRILVVSNLYPPNVIGGYERLCFDVAAALVAAGHEVTVLTSTFGGRTADFPGQRVHRSLALLTGTEIYDPYPGTADDRDAANRANVATFERTLAEARPDVVFAWNLFFFDRSLLDAMERAPVRTVLMLTDNWLLVMRNPQFVADFFRDCVHGDQAFAPPPPPPKPGILARLRARLAPAPPGLEAIFGADFVRDLYAAGGSAFPRHRVVHNGVPPIPAPAPPDRATLREPGTLRLLFAGRLVDLKGAHTAVAALPLLDPAALGVGRITLTIVGDTNDTAYMPLLHAAIDASGRAPDIALRLPVPVAELPALFADHDVYLFPSLYEPFSLTLIHALALGIPTIASATGGNTEIIEDGTSGLLFRKNDPASLAAAVTRLAHDPALRARLAAEGARSAARFTFDRMVAEMAAFLAAPR